MKTVLLLLVVLAAATGPAWALRCHVCSSATDCLKPQTCPSSSRYCKTQSKVDLLRGNLVEKDCADSCTPDSYQSSQVSSGSFSTLCCQGDLCNDLKLQTRLPNHAPARAQLSGCALPLALALGLLALLLAPGL
ncbi:lymphocyte antigen 6D [Pteronotus mesoamericanus]|uniref:lymphocyte antigen 6D n=1 Tax=Pteronotus mesoamericanus TaxID=1884717 RepID=UPI0023EAC41F|nr:lymphocyte antigen 6D [Pteronotus parnellii mesoamericanus]